MIEGMDILLNVFIHFSFLGVLLIFLEDKTDPVVENLGIKYFSGVFVAWWLGFYILFFTLEETGRFPSLYLLSQQTQMGGSHLENLLFSGNQDTHWALIYINGDLTVDAAVQIKPGCRKLGMCIYVAGDCIVDGLVSMTNRGANHSGKGTSGGYTVPVAIPLNGTLTIPATGGAGGARAGPTVRVAGSGTWLMNNGTAAGGSSTGTYCGSGGGASGAASHYDGTTNGGVYSGKGGDGTCFSGGG